MDMFSRLKNSVIIIFIVGILVNIFYDISGNGIVGVIKCSKDYRLARCMGYGNNSPIILMHDFFSLQAEDEITLSWNLLSKDQQYTFTHMPNGKKDKNYFHHFWDSEIEDFTIFKSTYERVHDQTAVVGFKICYKRDSIFLAKHAKKKPTKRFCSNDQYTIIRKQKEKSPYTWSIDTMNYEKCDSSDIKICNNYDFSKKYTHFSN